MYAISVDRMLELTIFAAYVIKSKAFPEVFDEEVLVFDILVQK
jgi:hypothetical protein